MEEFAAIMGRAARRRLENLADELGIKGQQREEMLKCNPITISGGNLPPETYGS